MSNLRKKNMNRTLEIAADLLARGCRVTVERVAKTAGLSERTVFRYWTTTENLSNYAAAALAVRLTSGEPLPNYHQRVLRDPAVVASILVACRKERIDNPCEAFVKIYQSSGRK